MSPNLPCLDLNIKNKLSDDSSKRYNRFESTSIPYIRKS
eukprot:UN06777